MSKARSGTATGAPDDGDPSDAVLRALGDQHRRQILRLVRDGELAAGEIAAPPADVFAYFTDPALLIRWIGERAERLIRRSAGHSRSWPWGDAAENRPVPLAAFCLQCLFPGPLRWQRVREHGA